MGARIIYDHREERSTIPGLLALEGFECVSQALLAGDYVLSDRLVIERKSAPDLIASIKDRRLWEQADRLREAYSAVVLLVEGTPSRFPVEGWKGALGSVLAMGGVSVLQTIDADESAEWIARLARREAREPTSSRGGPRKPQDPDRLAESVLSALPGVSSKGAERLLGHFGSLTGVFAADEQALRAVEGIGPKRASGLARAFSHRWRVAPWTQGSSERDAG